MLNRLYAAHPLIFADKMPPFVSVLHEGWYSIAHELCLAIEKTLTADELMLFQISGIKEKFGRLLIIYIGDWSEELDGLVDTAELQSTCTCQECGDHPARLRRYGVMKTLCDFCEKERKIRAARVSKKEAE